MEPQCGSFLVAAQLAQAAASTRTAGIRGDTAFSIFCWLEVPEFDLLFLFLCLWFVLHGTTFQLVCCLFSE